MHKSFLKISLAVLASTSAPGAIAAKTAAPVVVAVSPEAAAGAQMAINIIPDGIYARIMTDLMGNIDDMMEQVFGALGGVMGGEEQKGKSGAELKAQFEADMIKKDPHFKERKDITFRVMGEEMGKLFTKIEPVIRDGLGKSLSKKYTLAELNEMNGFFATPTGAKLGQNFMGMFTDKDLLTSMFKTVPDIIKEMPSIMQRVEKATAHLPKPQPAVNTVVDEAAMGAEAAGDAAMPAVAAAIGDTGNEPWFDRVNWSSADVKHIEALEAKSTASNEKSEAAYSAFEAEGQKVIDKMKARYLAKGWKPEPAGLPDQYSYNVAIPNCMRDGDNSDCEEFDLNAVKRSTELRSKWSAADRAAVETYETEENRLRSIAQNAQIATGRASEVAFGAQRQAGANAGQLTGVKKGSVAASAEAAGKAYDEGDASDVGAAAAANAPKAAEEAQNDHK
jgi:hypothetical protein